MSKTSKTKGNSYELKISKKLTEWSGETVHRVPQSGAGGSTGWTQDSRMAGDIVFPVESVNPFVFECKKRENWKMEHVLQWGPVFQDFWKQVVEDAMRFYDKGKAPMLIFSRNREKDYVILPYQPNLAHHLQDELLPCQEQRVYFDNVREERLEFDVIITTLDAIMEIPFPTVSAWYTNRKWNHLNEEV